MASHFDFGRVTFELLEDLGIKQELRGVRRQWGFLSTVGLTLGKRFFAYVRYGHASRLARHPHPSDNEPLARALTRHVPAP